MSAVPNDSAESLMEHLGASATPELISVSVMAPHCPAFSRWSTTLGGEGAYDQFPVRWGDDCKIYEVDIQDVERENAKITGIQVRQNRRRGR